MKFIFPNKIKFVRPSKHQASKKNFKHDHSPSKGELNTNCRIGVFAVHGLYLQKIPKYKGQQKSTMELFDEEKLINEM